MLDLQRDRPGNILGGNCASCRGTGETGNINAVLQALLVFAFLIALIYVVVSSLAH